MKTPILLLAIVFVAYSCDKTNEDTSRINDVDRNFALNASMANRAEINMGQIAATKATNGGVRDFGTLMVTEHTQSQSELRTAADSLNVYAPDSVDAMHAALKTQLMNLSGREFDSVYINSQVEDHKTALILYQNEANDGNNQVLRNYAATQLQHLQMHLHIADSLARQL